VNHLKSLADAGLTHVHLLPTYDFGSVPERVEWQKTVDHDWLASLPPNSPDQQAAVASVANDDAFNWGYDPVHYGVPEGSYATNPDGATRILEYRTMVKGLATLGLRTVCDVVYNHTLSAGPTDGRSVLDKVVPGYYHRRDLNGFYENSTCCNNTASENRMMERLIVDDLVHWARTYKVDGFRFDLMGHIMLRTMLRAKEALEQLTLKRDGVDGRKIYLYGEGWDYAEVAHGRVGTNASQINLGGTGIGSFNDRLREGVMGGSPFGDPRVQGVMTGLFFRPNMFIEQGDADEQRKRLVEDNEKVIAAMAGNLREYRFENKDGFQTPGRDACWVGSNVGYAAQPRETVNYVSAHDNETLFDGITLRSAPDVDLETRCRINRLAVATVAFSQGVPFFHAGDEILRSKSLDRDSYNSGDWFNRLDYTGQTHNFGIGLPRPREERRPVPVHRGFARRRLPSTGPGAHRAQRRALPRSARDPAVHAAVPADGRRGRAKTSHVLQHRRDADPGRDRDGRLRRRGGRRTTEVREVQPPAGVRQRHAARGDHRGREAGHGLSGRDHAGAPAAGADLSG
jgi:pullulanase-type alpha-1,6-glucosidase